MNEPRDTETPQFLTIRIKAKLRDALKAKADAKGLAVGTYARMVLTDHITEENSDEH